MSAQRFNPTRFTIPVAVHTLVETSAKVTPEQLSATLAGIDDLYTTVLTSPADTAATALFAGDAWCLHQALVVRRVNKAQDAANTLENHRRHVTRNDYRTALYVSTGRGFSHVLVGWLVGCVVLHLAMVSGPGR